MELAQGWVGPSVTQADRNDYIDQLKGLGSSDDEIQAILAEDDDFKDRVIELLPENKTAFYWFLDIDDLWQYTEGMRTCLDIQAILADAQISGRRYSNRDYQKLRIIGRHVIHCLAERYREQKRS